MGYRTFFYQWAGYLTELDLLDGIPASSEVSPDRAVWIVIVDETVNLVI